MAIEMMTIAPMSCSLIIIVTILLQFNTSCAAFPTATMLSALYRSVNTANTFHRNNALTYHFNYQVSILLPQQRSRLAPYLSFNSASSALDTAIMQHCTSQKSAYLRKWTFSILLCIIIHFVSICYQLKHRLC